jgi:hypothetical protein
MFMHILCIFYVAFIQYLCNLYLFYAVFMQSLYDFFCDVHAEFMQCLCVYAGIMHCLCNLFMQFFYAVFM